MSANPKILSRAWLMAGLLCGVARLNYLDRVMVTTMRVSLKQAIPMTDAQFGLLTSAFLWVYSQTSFILAAFYWGMLRLAGWAIVGWMPILCLLAEPRYRATGYGVLNLFACLVGGVTIYAGGAPRDANVNLQHIFHLAAFSLLLCAALLFLVKPAEDLRPNPDFEL